MKYIIDRIEGVLAVCEREDGVFEDIHLSELPEYIHEGSVLINTEGVWSIDTGAEAQRRKEIFELQDSLFK